MWKGSRYFLVVALFPEHKEDDALRRWVWPWVQVAVGAVGGGQAPFLSSR